MSLARPEGNELVSRRRTVWVRAGSALGEAWWYPPTPAPFELVARWSMANATEVRYPPSPWDCTVPVHLVAAGPEPDDMRVLTVLDNGPLLVPPGGVLLFARHALTLNLDAPWVDQTNPSTSDNVEP